MNTGIPLKVLVEAKVCFQLVRETEAAGKRLSTPDYLRVLRAHSEYSSYIDTILQAQEVTATIQ